LLRSVKLYLERIVAGFEDILELYDPSLLSFLGKLILTFNLFDSFYEAESF